MENPDPGVGLPQSPSEPEQEQRDNSEPDTQPESNQGTPEPRNNPPPQAFIRFRIQQLHNRRFLLLKMQHLRKTVEDNNDSTTEEMTSEDSDEMCELEAIQKELEELEKRSNGSPLYGNPGQQDVCPTLYKTETPYGGIYMLPPPHMTPDSPPEHRVKTRPGAETPAGPAVPMDSLGQTAAVTQCPSCREVVMTETSSRVGETVWMVCCLCSMIGCVGGCCLIPFFMSQLRNTEHHCPRCQAHIHTHKPF